MEYTANQSPEPITTYHEVMVGKTLYRVTSVFKGEMRKQGAGCTSIVRALNSDGILPPKLHYALNNDRDTSRIRFRQWICTGVNAVVKNEVYIGTAVQLVKKTVSYRNGREVMRPTEEWIRVENAYPAIVDRETWGVVQEVNRKATERYANRRKPRKSLFSGLLSCGGCGSSLVYRNDSRLNRNGDRVEFGSYLCTAHLSTCGAACSKHHVYETMLKEVVLGHVQLLAEQIALDEDAMLQSLTRRLIGNRSASKAEAEQERRSLRHQLKQLEGMTAKLYEDRVMGVLSEESFSVLARENESERLEKQQRLALLEQSEQEVAEKLSDIERWMRLIREKSSLADVDREMLESLVEKIEVGERKVVNGEKRQDIRIYYRFVGLL